MKNQFPVMSSFPKTLLVSIPAAIVVGAAIFYWHRNRRKALRPVGHVSGLYIYPIKSCKGLQLNSAKCIFEGLEYDRRWVIVNGKGSVVSCKTVDAMVLISPHFDEDMTHLYLDAPGMETLKIPLSLKTDKVMDITVSGSVGKGVCVGDAAAEWISTFLKVPGCRLCHVTKPRYLSEHPKWGFRGKPNDKTAFASTSSILICSQSSLKELDKHYDSPLDMDRFRPNIVVDGGKAYEEDLWRRVKISDNVQLRFVKECGRCPAVNVNPVNGERTQEPLHTLNRVRKIPGADKRHNDHPLFGWCCVPDAEGQITIGDPVFASC